MAEVYSMAVAPHNPNGPIATAAAAHFAFATPNWLIQEAIDRDVPWREEVVDSAIAVAGGAIATIQKLGQEPVHEHVSRLGERTRRDLRPLYDRLGVPAVVSGFGSVFVSYFLEGPVESYDDLLRNDVDLLVGYRRELMRHGIFELPLNLKRSDFSYAHREEDVDHLLEATEKAVLALLTRRGS